MSSKTEVSMPVRFGAPQECPACTMYNKSGLVLPEECQWCNGTGMVDLGFSKEEIKNLISSPGPKLKLISED